MPRVFLTGASGEIGQVLVPLLLEKFELCALRRGPLPPGLQNLPNIHWVEGSLEQPEMYTNALKGVETIIHLGALVNSTNLPQLERVNVQGTLDLVHAAQEAGCKQILVASTAAVTQDYLTPYARSKKKMEGELSKISFPQIIVRPTLVYGKNTRFNARLKRVAHSPFPITFLPNGGKANVCPVHVEDVARAIVCLVEHGAFSSPGKVWDLAPTQGASLRACLETVFELEKKKKWIGGVPIEFVKPFAQLANQIPLPFASIMHSGAAIASSYKVQPSSFPVKCNISFRAPLAGIQESWDA